MGWAGLCSRGQWGAKQSPTHPPGQVAPLCMHCNGRRMRFARRRPPQCEGHAPPRPDWSRQRNKWWQRVNVCVRHAACAHVAACSLLQTKRAKEARRRLAQGWGAGRSLTRTSPPCRHPHASWNSAPAGDTAEPLPLVRSSMRAIHCVWRHRCSSAQHNPSSSAALTCRLPLRGSPPPAPFWKVQPCDQGQSAAVQVVTTALRIPHVETPRHCVPDVLL